MLDACVLYPANVRDVLISFHVADLYAARWTVAVEEEWISSLLGNRPDIPRERLLKTRDMMRSAVPDWEVSSYMELVEGLELPDPGDRHVLAAAIRGHADCIVTANLTDFPLDYLKRFDLEAIHPDDFIILQMDLDQVRPLLALKAMRARMRNPQLTAEAFADRFEQVGLPSTASRLRDALGLI